MEGHPIQPSERVPALQEYLTKWTPHIHPVKSPEEEFQENIKRAQDLFNGLTHSSQNSIDKLDEILRCGARIKELMALHEDNKVQKEREYQQKLWEQQETLVIEILDLFGLELGIDLCTKWHNRFEKPSSPTTTHSDSGPVDAQQTEHTTVSRFVPVEDPTPQPTGTDQPPAKSTNFYIPSPVNTENTGEPSTRPSQPGRPEQNTSAGPPKRPLDPPAARPTRPTKRSRSDLTQGPLTGDRTIEFEQVYQNGQAEPKYVIMKHNRFWYILECKKHKLHFNNHPIRGALKHLRGKKHQHPNVNYEEAIRALGTRVLHCDEDKAAENNAVARRPSYSQMGRPVHSLSPSVGHGLPTRSNQSLAGIDPKPGEVYTTFWSETKQFFAVLVLPWCNVGQLGKDLSLTVKDTVLIKKVPSCYRYNDVDESFEWALDYGPGGQHYSKRKYPIMYFDAPVFPGECRVNWVAAREFQLYDPQVATIPFKGIVDRFIASRNSGGGDADPHTQAEQGTVDDDRPTAEIFPREEQRPGAREIIVIDDDSDDDTVGRYRWSDAPVAPGDPVPKIEPQDEPMTDVHDQQGTSTNHDNASSQQPLNTGVANHSQRQTGEFVDSHDNLMDPAGFLRRLDNAGQPDPILLNPDHAQVRDGMPGPQVPTGDACDMQAQAPKDGPTAQWRPAFSGEEHEPSPIANTNFHSHHLPPPTTTKTRPPEAVMTPLPPNQKSPPAPVAGDNSQQQPTSRPSQDSQTTELYSYFNQARNASSQFQLDSDGRFKWIAPETTSGMAKKQKPMSVRQHEELRARMQAIGKESQPTQHQAPTLAPKPPGQTGSATPHGFKRSF
ncbi:hypothetical protein F53441_14396 [Fusarium austroafricanum]|uniref:Uncharacterized protein n=1 Tax=Fusarium austroafricanum TaxID=2364996 RepID=A0A8H4JDJ1_9HYPO|nr:hypothetical protein F53441_14396 [Fusarium austroafricanum]